MREGRRLALPPPPPDVLFHAREPLPRLAAASLSRIISMGEPAPARAFFTREGRCPRHPLLYLLLTSFFYARAAASASWLGASAGAAWVIVYVRVRAFGYIRRFATGYD